MRKQSQSSRAQQCLVPVRARACKRGGRTLSFPRLASTFSWPGNNAISMFTEVKVKYLAGASKASHLDATPSVLRSYPTLTILYVVRTFRTNYCCQLASRCSKKYRTSHFVSWCQQEDFYNQLGFENKVAVCRYCTTTQF